MLPFTETSLTSLVGHFTLINETFLCLIEKKHADIFRYLGFVSCKACALQEEPGFLTHQSMSRNINDNFSFFDIVILALL